MPPHDNVTVSLQSNDLSEGTISPNSLVFTPANWNTPQSVTVTGQEDDTSDHDVTYEISRFIDLQYGRPI